MNPTGRNAPCPCGSGLKYKKCCLGSGIRAPGPNRPAGSIPWAEIRRIDALLNHGYLLEHVLRTEEACEAWHEVWRLVAPRLRPEMRRCKLAAHIFSDHHYLSDWIQDFGESLQNAAVSDREWARAGITFCSEVLAQFPDEDAHIRENFRGHLGTLHYKAGQPDQGEKVLMDLIRDLPHRSIGYAFLSDLLGETNHPWSKRGPVDRPRAIALLEQALARPVEDPEDWDLEYRLEQLKNEE